MLLEEFGGYDVLEIFFYLFSLNCFIGVDVR